MGVLQKEHRTIQWMNAVVEHKDWNLFTWYWSTLACEYQNDEEGKVYMDTMPDENDKSKVIVQLGNRANNVEMLKKTLERIGCPEKIDKIEKADCYVTLATINSLEPEMVGKELNEWIRKISEKISQTIKKVKIMGRVFAVCPKRVKRTNGQVLTPDMEITVTTLQYTSDPFYNGAKEIQEQYMRMYQFDYKKSCCSKFDFEFKQLD